MRRVARLLLERLDDHPLDVIIADGTRLSRSRLVMQSIKPPPGEATPPLAHSRGIAAQPLGDLLTGLSIRRRQHDPTAQRQRLRALRPPSPPLQHLAILIAEHNLGTLSHKRLQSSSIPTTNSRLRTLFLRTNDSGH